MQHITVYSTIGIANTISNAKSNTEPNSVTNSITHSVSNAKPNSVSNAKDADLTDRIARERYDVIAAPMITTLQALSGADVRDPNEWRTWWNKNKKKNWDEQ